MRYDAYVFDLDGTLLDTLGDLASSLNHALARHGLPCHGVDAVRAMVGNGMGRLVESAVPGGRENPLFEDVLAGFMAHYMEHGADTTRPYPGIVETLKALRSAGKALAVVSNKSAKATGMLCERFLGGLVDVAIGESEGIARKPAPDTVLEALARLGADPRGAVYIGDSEVDIATARNCGLPCVSVLWGFRDRDFLLAAGAVRLVSRPGEILSL